MKQFAVLVCALAVVTATPLFGTEQCAKGPEVWCENLRTADQCGAVKHCQQTVWNKPTVKALPCDMCKEVITVVGNFLKDNMTQGEIKDYLNKMCDLLPDPGLSATCKQELSEYFPIVLNMLEQELSNPGVLCSALGLCTSLQRHLASLKHPKQLLTNEIPDVDASKLVYPYIVNVPQLLNPQEETFKEPKTGDICNDCLKLVSDVQDALRSNASFSKNLVDHALHECELLDPGMAEMCKSYINQFSDVAIQVLLQMDQVCVKHGSVQPKQLCSMVGFCDQEKSTPLQNIIPAKTLIPAAKVQPAVKITENPLAGNGVFCEVCQLMISQIEKLLDNNRTKENIKHSLEKVCKLLPAEYSQKCEDIIEEYYDPLIELLEQEANPQFICTTLGYCSARRKNLQNVKISAEKAAAGDYCTVCKMMMKYVDELLEKNATEIRIKNFLSRVCNFLPDSMQDECSGLVNEYEPLFVQLLLEALDPSFICAKLHLCQSEKVLLGTEKCMWGPSYWCKDMETAANCNAVDHCRRHVWN
uniref:Prosaposin n=1 Tax=Xenopus tropicalis TaxID=8364 RepID=A0A6I8PNJ7_XENTR